MNGFGWQASRFAGQSGALALRGGVPGRPRLGQSDTGEWKTRAQAAVQAFDLLLGRTQQVGNPDARKALMDWVSTPDAPGTPAERYRVVVDDLAQGAPWAEVGQKRVTDLELMDMLFETKVKQAEQAFAPAGQPEQPGMIVNLRGAFTPTGIVLGAAGILGLLVVPLVMGD